MKYALIGCGRISVNHLAVAQENDDLDIVAICDIDPDAMQRKAEQFGIEDVPQYEDYHDLLAQERPELVAICTESGSHARIAIDCLNAGAHVIIEKPIALSLADADAIIEAGKVNDRLVCACHQNRFNKAIRIMHDAVEGGRFGKLMHGAAHIRWNRGPSYYEQAPWRGTWAEDGGALMNQCIHNIDLLRWMMGDDIDEVFAYTSNQNHDYIEAEDLGLAVVKFSNGAYGLIEGTVNVYPKNLEETLYLFGTTGTAKAGGKSVNLIEAWDFADGADDLETVAAETHEAPANVYGFGHTPLYADVIDAVKTGRAPFVDGEAGKRALELVLAIYKSARDGEPVKLPLEDFASTDMEGMFR